MIDVLLTRLLNDLATLPDDVIFVLDDYHTIDGPAIHRAMAFLLDHLLPRVHFVITLRADPPLPVARLRARRQLTELRAADLRCTADEASAFLTGTMGLQLPADAVNRIEGCTEGWIAGLQLVALTLKGRDPVQIAALIAVFRGTNRSIIDFLADEVFNHQSEEIQRFLLHSSELGRLNGALCDVLDGQTGLTRRTVDGQSMLERLDTANLFLIPLDETRTWYRYHHVFAGFLRERLRRP